MSAKPVGIGLIGVGGIAQNHQLPAYQKLQDEGKVRIARSVSSQSPIPTSPLQRESARNTAF
jgi:hypothetical protein